MIPYISKTQVLQIHNFDVKLKRFVKWLSVPNLVQTHQLNGNIISPEEKPNVYSTLAASTDPLQPNTLMREVKQI